MLPDERDPSAIGKRATKTTSMALYAIAILGAGFITWVFLFPFTGGCGESVKRADAGTTVRIIVSALRSYENDYGRFPEIPGTHLSGKQVFCFGAPTIKNSDGPNSLVFDVLRAIPRGANADHALNKRQQKYFQGPKAKDPKHPHSGFADGPEFAEAVQGCLFDPWGHQYCIVFTRDESGKLLPSVIYSDLTKPSDVIQNSVASFSLGKDGIPGGKGYEGKFRMPASSEPPDDIVSWQ